ncbi:unnamed protein product [Closterium sp. Naga37s-1]|nr:unnamed protein product [Closterium sp. Naga37s-1]
MNATLKGLRRKSPAQVLLAVIGREAVSTFKRNKEYEEMADEQLPANIVRIIRENARCAPFVAQSFPSASTAAALSFTLLQLHLLLLPTSPTPSAADAPEVSPPPPPPPPTAAPAVVVLAVCAATDVPGLG